MKLTDTTHTEKLPPLQSKTDAIADKKHDDAHTANAIKTKAPGNHANAKITAQPGSQGTIDTYKRKVP